MLHVVFQILGQGALGLTITFAIARMFRNKYLRSQKQLGVPPVS